MTTPNPAIAARRRLRENARRHGFAYVMLHTVGLTVEQKIARWSGPTLSNGCIPWIGAKGTPALRFDGKLHSVRILLWEKRGEKVPKGYVVTITCGNDRCIAEAHLVMMTRGKCLHAPKNQEKRDQMWRSKHGKDRERVLMAAFEKVPVTRASLRRKYPNLDIEDILQEALLSVYLASLKTGAVIDDPGALLYRSAMNMAIDLLRHNSVVTMIGCDPQSPALLHHAAPLHADPAMQYESALVAYRSQKRLTAHLRKVPVRARKAIRLQQQYGLSQDEVAARMGISVNTVEQHLQKARRLLVPGKRTGWRNAL